MTKDELEAAVGRYGIIYVLLQTAQYIPDEQPRMLLIKFINTMALTLKENDMDILTEILLG